MRILVTGSAGFIGRHITEALRRRGDEVIGFTEEDALSTLGAKLDGVDAVIHLAGVNRPQDPSEFITGNAGVTETLCSELSKLTTRPLVMFSSSTQAELDNPYGVSKRQAEMALERLAADHGNPVVIFRLTNVFGKWARPNYNSAVATFCHNTAKGLPIQINDPSRVMSLVYVDDVVTAMVGVLDEQVAGCEIRSAQPTYEITLQGIADLVQGFRDVRTTLVMPDLAPMLHRHLYATYISYLEGPEREYQLDIKTDPRGSLAEFLKSPHFGQIFVSRTKPGITRGNHYHHSKCEKFLVLEGEAIIRFRHIETNQIDEYTVRGTDYQVVDITPGWTHSIENIGSGELITLFWANEIFDPSRPDTYFEEVLK